MKGLFWWMLYADLIDNELMEFWLTRKDQDEIYSVYFTDGKKSSVIHTYGQYLPHGLMRFLSVIEIVCIENLDLMILCGKM